MVSILILHPGRCGSHWLLNMLKTLTGLHLYEGYDDGRQIWGTREQMTHGGLERLRATTDLVFLLRDPRDVLVSMGAYSQNVVQGHFDAEMRSIWQDLGWFRWYLEMHGQIKHCTVRYEDLWTAPLQTMRVVLAYLGRIVPSDEIIAKVIEHESFIQRTGRERGQELASHHLRKGIIGDWKNVWNENTKNQFDTRFHRELEELGYADQVL